MMDSSGHGRCSWPAECEWVGSSASVQRVKQQLREAAATRLPVLLIGEVGTGRRLSARTLHQLSPHAGGRFVQHPCAAIHPARIDHEIFADALLHPETSRSPDDDAVATGGTIFLEDVDLLPATAQQRLLETMQEACARAPEHHPDRTPAVRWIASTGRDLGQSSRAGTFCAELFYRLSIISIQLPPLRQHREDIPVLAQRIIGECAARMGRAGTSLTDAALRILLAHAWPGNVWELKRLLERAVTLADGGRILPRHLHTPLCLLPSDPRSRSGLTQALIGIVPPGPGGHPELN